MAVARAAPCGLDGDRKAGGDRGLTRPRGGGPDSRGATFLSREEWRRSRQGKKVGTTLLSPGDRSAPARCPSARSAIAEAAPGRPGQFGQEENMVPARSPPHLPRNDVTPRSDPRPWSARERTLPRTRDHAPCHDRRGRCPGTTVEQGGKNGALSGRTPSRPEHRTDAVLKTGASRIEGSHPLPIPQEQTRPPILCRGPEIREPVQFTPPVCMEIE